MWKIGERRTLRMPMFLVSAKFSITHAENGDTMLAQFIIVIFHPTQQLYRCSCPFDALYIYVLRKFGFLVLDDENAAINTNGAARTNTRTLLLI